jgi:predicted lipoprotein
MKPLVATLSLLLALPAAAATVEQEAATQRLLAEWAVSPLLSNVQRFAERSAALAPAFNRLCSAPGNAAQLKAARAVWQQAYLAWMPVANFNWGPTALRRTGRQLAFRPARPELIQAAIAADAGRKVEAWDKIGVPAKGFAAMEQLLHKDSAKLKQPAACAYLVRLGTEAGDEARGLAADWPAFAAELKHAGYSSSIAYPKASAALSEMVNLLIAASTELGEKTLGKISKQKQDAVLGVNSGSGRALVAAQWTGLATVVAGSNNQGGLATLLEAAYEKPVLARQLRDVIAEGRQAIAALPANLGDAKPAALERAHAAVAKLQDLLETPTAQALDLTVSFNESDGD